MRLLWVDLIASFSLSIRSKFIFLIVSIFYGVNARLQHWSYALSDRVPCAGGVIALHVKFILVSVNCNYLFLDVRRQLFAIFELEFQFFDYGHNFLEGANRPVLKLIRGEPASLLPIQVGLDGVARASHDNSIRWSVNNMRLLTILLFIAAHVFIRIRHFSSRLNVGGVVAKNRHL